MRPFSIDELVGGSHEKALRILAMMRILSKAPTALTRWGSTMLRSTLAIPLRSTRKWARPTCTTVMPPRSHRPRQTIRRSGCWSSATISGGGGRAGGLGRL